uniref:SHSP domain-containing protein n=1 Tax=Parastrongyloides trichosuri TaxID=131310 RepID=A0A0N4Z0W0_PARTI
MGLYHYGPKLHRPEPEFGYIGDIIEDIQRSICPYEYTFRRNNEIPIFKRNNDDFYLKIDISKFQPSELKVKIDKEFLIIEGHHDAKDDGCGVIERHFVRKIKIPEGIDKDKIQGDLTSNGILTIKGKRLLRKKRSVEIELK